jgi:formylglycine-generating enzyme required for sulfatase activity
VLAFLFCAAAHAATIDIVPVGNPGNAADTTGSGLVGYNYHIGKYEVTNAQYVEFLNVVDPTGANTLALYNTNMAIDARGGILADLGAADGSKYSVKPGRNNNPVVFVSWYDSIRFANWMHNGMRSGDTENGAYTLLGGTPTPSNGNSIMRNPGAGWWLPSKNEWYKAAYHKNDGATGNYWEYPTSTDANPYSDQPPGTGAPDPSNTANFRNNDGLANGYDDGYAVTGSLSFDDAQNYLTDVGAYTSAHSPYGTFDQGGNVWEWGETLSSFRGLHGGAWSGTFFLTATSQAVVENPTAERNDIGFRVASIPEPSTIFLLSLAAVSALVHRAFGRWRPLLSAAICAALLAQTTSAAAITIETVSVGDPGNANDPATGN